MLIECQNTHILQTWSPGRGNVMNGLVLVEFSIQADTPTAQNLRSHLVEHVRLKTGPDISDDHATQRLTRRAFEQVVQYFDGDGARENVFLDSPLPAKASSEKPCTLSPEDEAELEAELRVIEREYETA